MIFKVAVVFKTIKCTFSGHWPQLVFRIGAATTVVANAPT